MLLTMRPNSYRTLMQFSYLLNNAADKRGQWADRGPRLDVIFGRGYSKDIKYSRFFGYTQRRRHSLANAVMHVTVVTVCAWYVRPWLCNSCVTHVNHDPVSLLVLFSPMLLSLPICLAIYKLTSRIALREVIDNPRQGTGWYKCMLR